MSNDNSSGAGGGIGCLSFFAIVLTIVFIVLKLCKVIDWSWIWVLAPLWIYVALLLIGLLLFVILMIILNK